jgi:hypothetical protein
MPADDPQNMAEADESDLLPKLYAQDIRAHLAKLKNLSELLPGEHADLNAYSPGDPDFTAKLFEWSKCLGEGEVPACFGELKPVQRKELTDLLYYLLLVGTVRNSVERGLAGVLAAWPLARGSDEEGPEQLAPREGDVPPERERYRILRSAEAATQLKDASVDLVRGLRAALGLLADMNPKHLILGARTYRQNKVNAQRLYRQAGVELFRKIMEGEGVRQLGEIWKWAGTGYYKTVKLEGVRFTFTRFGQELHVSRSDNPSYSHCIEYVPATLYEWRREALANPGNSPR